MVELARALANTKGVHRVDLLTRQISSPEVDYSYGEPVEMLSCPSDGTGSCGAYIIRIPCGPCDKYVFLSPLNNYILIVTINMEANLVTDTYKKSPSGLTYLNLLMEL